MTRRDGKAAAGAWVLVEAEPDESAHCSGRGVTLDADGRGELAALVEGRYRVALRQPGLVPTSVPVRVVAGREVEAVVVEPRGARVEVSIVDDTGSSLPFATVEIEQASHVRWLDVDDEGLQRLDMFVDERGRRVFDHLESGEVEIEARWGTRARRIRVAATNASATEATVVLPRPALAGSTPAGEGG